MATKDMRNLPPHAQDAIRERAIALVREGMTQAEAARVFGTSRESVSRWINKAKRLGKGALVSKLRGRPPGGMIRAHEVKLILGWIKNKTPDQLDLPFVLWTREVVGQLIKSGSATRSRRRRLGSTYDSGACHRRSR